MNKVQVCNKGEYPRQFNVVKGSPSHSKTFTYVQLTKKCLDEDGTWSGILASTDFAVNSTNRTKLQATLGQLVFGCNMILNTPFIADWEDIMRRKQQLIEK